MAKEKELGEAPPSLSFCQPIEEAAQRKHLDNTEGGREDKLSTGGPKQAGGGTKRADHEFGARRRKARQKTDRINQQRQRKQAAAMVKRNQKNSQSLAEAISDGTIVPLKVDRRDRARQTPLHIIGVLFDRSRIGSFQIVTQSEIIAKANNERRYFRPEEFHALDKQNTPIPNKLKERRNWILQGTFHKEKKASVPKLTMQKCHKEEVGVSLDAQKCCGCKKGCKGSCRCRRAKQPCRSSCGCGGGSRCENPAKQGQVLRGSLGMVQQTEGRSSPATVNR